MKKHSARTISISCALLLSTIPSTPIAGGRIVNESGLQVPGLPAGITFGGTAHAAVDESGRVAYMHFLQGTTQRTALFIDDVLVARQGEAVAGMPSGTTFAGIVDLVRWNSAGSLLWQAILTGPGITNGVNGAVLYRDNSVVLQTGNSLPGFPLDTVLDAFLAPHVSSQGQLSFSGTVRTPGIFSQIIYSKEGVLVRSGQQLPGLPPGSTALTFATGLQAANDAGQIAYLATLSPGTVQAIYRDATPLAVTGQQIPGLPTGTVLVEPDAPRINQSGQVAFRSRTVFQGTLGAAIFRDQTVIAHTGGQAPGLANVTISGLPQFAAPALNDSGHVAFLADLSGPSVGFDNQAIYRNDLLIARKGTTTPSGWVIGSADRFTGPMLSSGGFVSFISEASNGQRQGRAIWIGDGQELVDMFLPGDFIGGKAVSFVNGWPSESTLNNRGQAAFSVMFSSSTGTREGVVLFAPNLYWRGASTGEWSDSNNWSFGLRPDETYGARIMSTGAVRVLGPLAKQTVNLLQIGGESGSATLELRGGTQLTVSNSPVQIRPGGILTGDGSLIAGVTNFGKVEVNNLTISEGMTNQGLVSGSGTLTTTLINGGLGEVRTAPSGHLRIVGNAINSGLLSIGVSSTQEYTGSLHNSGRIAAANQSELRVGGSLRNFGRLELNGATVLGAIDARSGIITVTGNEPSSFGGVVQLRSGAEFNVSEEATAIFREEVNQHTGAILSGTGTKRYENGFSVGESPGLGIDAGSIQFGMTNTYLVEIGGIEIGRESGEGIEFDRYVVAGKLMFGGNLKIVWLDNYNGKLGDHWDLFDWGLLEGQFSALDFTGASLGEGLKWDVSQLYSTGQISVAAVPEPGQWFMLLAGLSVIGWRQSGKLLEPAKARLRSDTASPC